jgi:hypothetical protein
MKNRRKTEDAWGKSFSGPPRGREEQRTYEQRTRLRVGDLLLIPLGFGGMVNHSKHPNMEKVIDGQTVYLRTTRTIHPGEELFFTYGEEFLKVVEFRGPYLTPKN